MGDIPKSQDPPLPVLESLLTVGDFSDAFDYSFLYDGSLQLPVVERSPMEVEDASMYVVDYAFAPIKYSDEVPDKWLFPTCVPNEQHFAGVQRPSELYIAPNKPLLKPQRHPFCFPKPGVEYADNLLAISEQKVKIGQFINANSTGWPNLPHNLYSSLKPRNKLFSKKAVSSNTWRPSRARAMPLKKAHDILKFVRDLKPGLGDNVEQKEKVIPPLRTQPDVSLKIRKSGTGHRNSHRFYEKKHPEKYDDLLKMPLLERTAKLKAFFEHIGLSINAIQRLLGSSDGRYGNRLEIKSFFEGDCTNTTAELAFRISNLYLNLRYSPEFVTELWDFKTVKFLLHKKYINGMVAMWDKCPNLDKLHSECKCTTKLQERPRKLEKRLHE